MQEKDDKKKRKKMNTLELLYNKALMKAAAEEDDQVRKTKVWYIWFKPILYKNISISTKIKHES